MAERWYETIGTAPRDNISSGGTMRKFYTVNGDTAVTNEFTTKLKKEGKTEVSKEKREFTLAFCRISTRPGIDIQETQDKCPEPADGKPVILVLLHHTFDPKYCDYRGPGIKNDASTILSVDLLYYEDRLLKCPHNKRGLKQVLDVVGRPSWKEKSCKYTILPRYIWSYSNYITDENIMLLYVISSKCDS
ncbi:uncharacterized protein LOC130374140 isoform X3 [Gadus chalcogrammus]|uniref:uncharacterized protein LOC130374140 isoform X3 n=1 Tax=Gadus chalcogrammus TaxID=1042646 RepID=UPI0024C4883B|nr:uncharacterized protein LOC130374140 isoform X3 [Gadus chalcogrammus]